MIIHGHPEDRSADRRFNEDGLRVLGIWILDAGEAESGRWTKLGEGIIRAEGFSGVSRERVGVEILKMKRRKRTWNSPKDGLWSMTKFSKIMM